MTPTPGTGSVVPERVATPYCPFLPTTAMVESMFKRKRSLQDTPIDSSKIRHAREYLEKLKEELDGIEETEETMNDVMDCMQDLEQILTRSKKQVSIILYNYDQ